MGLVALLVGGEAEAFRSADESIVPLKEYAAADSRALAETHKEELRRLYDEVRRCVPELDFQAHGIGFRRPRYLPTAPPHLFAWVWLDAGQPPGGGDLAGRAADAFRRYSRKLFARLVARSAVQADARVGGYALVLTWIGPTPGDRPISETLVLFAEKAVAQGFADGSVAASGFLSKVGILAFDGQTEVKALRFPVEDHEVQAPPNPC